MCNVISPKYITIIFAGHIAKPWIDCIPTNRSVYFSTVGKSTFKQVKLAKASWQRPVSRQKQKKKKHCIQPKTHFCPFCFFGQNILPVRNPAAGGRPYFKLLLVLHLQTPPSHLNFQNMSVPVFKHGRQTIIMKCYVLKNIQYQYSCCWNTWEQ